VIDEEILREAMARQKIAGERLGETLIKMGKITADELVKALSFQVTEEVCELFTWEDVFCEFVAGEPAPETFETDEFTDRISLASSGVVMEAARRIDEWENIRKTLPSWKDVLIVKKKPDPSLRGTLKEELLRWADGTRDVDEILERARMSRFNALRTIKTLIDEGYLRTRTARELVEAAKVVGDKGGGREAGISKIIKLYERAEELGINNPKISLWLAKAYERLKKEKESVTRYKSLGKGSLEKGNLDEAAGHYRKIVTMNADDLESHERLVETLLKLGRDAEARDEGLLLLDKYRGAGRAADALSIAVKLEERAKDDTDLLQRLAGTYLDAGDRIQALILLETLAEIYERGRDDAAAIAVFERMLEIDNENIDAHFRLASALTRSGRTRDAVKRYKALADILTSSGVLENSINWQFLINVYQNLLAIEPGNLLAREWLADAFVSKGDRAKAVESLRGLLSIQKEVDPGARINPLRKLVELDPADLEARHALGAAYAEAGNREDAISEYAELAHLAFEKGDVDLALRSFDRAIGLDPTDAGTWEGLAKVYLGAGRPHEAAGAFRDAAGLCRTAGRLDHSLSLLRAALEADPERLDPLLDLAAIHRRREDIPAYQAAIREFASRNLGRQNFGETRMALNLLLALNKNDPWALDLAAKLDGRGPQTT
jgi:tetratricopeptide (TPR) repeat protein